MFNDKTDSFQGLMEQIRQNSYAINDLNYKMRLLLTQLGYEVVITTDTKEYFKKLPKKEKLNDNARRD